MAVPWVRNNMFTPVPLTKLITRALTLCTLASFPRSGGAVHDCGLNAALSAVPVQVTRLSVAAVALHLFVQALDWLEPGLVAIVKAILEAQKASTFTHLLGYKAGSGLAVTTEGRRLTLEMAGVSWAIMTPGARGAVRYWRITVRSGNPEPMSHTVVGVIGTTDPGEIALHHGSSFGHATGNGWCGSGEVYLAGQWMGNTNHGGWPNVGWLDGDEAGMRVDTAAKTLTLKHRRHSSTFTIAIGSLEVGGTARDSEWFVNVSLDADHSSDRDSVEVQPLTAAEFDAFLE